MANFDFHAIDPSTGTIEVRRVTFGLDIGNILLEIKRDDDPDSDTGFEGRITHDVDLNLVQYAFQVLAETLEQNGYGPKPEDYDDTNPDEEPDTLGDAPEWTN